MSDLLSKSKFRGVVLNVWPRLYKLKTWFFDCGHSHTKTKDLGKESELIFARIMVLYDFAQKPKRNKYIKKYTFPKKDNLINESGTQHIEINYLNVKLLSFLQKKILPVHFMPRRT